MRKAILLAGIVVVATVMATVPSSHADSSTFALPEISTPAGTLFHGGEVNGSWTVFVDSSPSPYCGLEWNASLAAGEVYHHTSLREDEPCRSAWSIDCTGDSLSYRGSWITDDPTAYHWNFAFVDLSVSARLEFAVSTRVFAVSTSTGVLEGDSHQVVITPAGGLDQILLGPSPGAAAEVELRAGIYTITIAVAVTEHHTHHEYGASLVVWWEDGTGVPVRPSTWSGVKALYR